MDQKPLSIQHLVYFIKHAVENARAHNQVDYNYDPVTGKTHWDFIPSDTIRTVYSLDGDDAPEINTHLNEPQQGIVITFDADIGGNQQIFLNNYVLADRQIGNPAGWSYMSLTGADKVYIDQNTADILNSITDETSNNEYVQLQGNQTIKGVKNFTSRPLVNNDPVATRAQVISLDKYIKANMIDIHHITPEMDSLKSDTLANTSRINSLASHKAANASAQPDLGKIKATIHRVNVRAMDLDNQVKSLEAKPSPSNAQVASLANAFNSFVAKNDLGKVKATIHKMDLRASDTDSGLASQGASLKSLATNMSNVNHIASDANVANTHVANIANNLRDVKNAQHKADIRASNEDSAVARSFAMTNSNVAKASSSVSINTNQLHATDVDLFNTKQAIKRADKRNTDAQSSLSIAAKSQASTISQLASSANSLTNSMATVYGHVPAQISVNAARLNSDANLMYAVKQSIKRADKRNEDIETSLSTVVSGLAGKDNQSNNTVNNTSASSELASLSTVASNDASRLNNATTDLYNIKQHNRKANKRYTDAIASLSTANSGAVANEHVDIQSLANRISNTANASAESKINSAVNSAKAVVASQSTTNASLSTAIITNSAKASTIDSTLTSALSKGKLK